jgi:hypothetical protein
MFAVLTLERDLLQLADVPLGIVTWVQVIGSLAAVCLLVWMVLRLFLGGWWSAPDRPWTGAVFNVLIVGAGLGYFAFLIFRVPDILTAVSGEVETADPSPGRVRWAAWILFAAAACALLAVSLPFFVNLLDLRWRRIWGITRLSFKEAVRRRVPYIFCALILVVLFLQWFEKSKPEKQLQHYVEIVSSTMTPLLLLSAALLASFSIPTDIKQQTIHTVVTKPVERFEIILGRFLGYTLLMTLLLFLMTGLSLFYVLRGINPEAAEESLKAREPIYGTLSFQRVEGEYTERERASRVAGFNVGKEWDYRGYVPGQDENRPHDAVFYAVWSFKDLPAKLARRDTIRCEFTFEIYRESKGRENQGVLCSFFFQTRNYEKTRAKLQKYQDERRKQAAGVDLNPFIDNALSETFGYFEIQGKAVSDDRTLFLDIPAGLIRNALEESEDSRAPATPLEVRVRCGSQGQMVGMARYDLYLRGDDPRKGPSTLAFAINYFKASVGLWMRVVLIIALCVTVSTELGGIITFLCVMMLYLGGVNRDFVKEIALRANVGGGPLESAYRMATRQHTSIELEESNTTRAAIASDEAFRWMMRFMLDVLPDTDRYSFTDRVANGFNVGLIRQDLLPALLMLLGYLIPWAIGSFYLIRAREIAGAT